MRRMSSTAARVLRVGGVPEHFNAPWHTAAKAGLFAERGIDVRWTDFPGGTGAMAKALRDGELDVAILLTEGIVAAAAHLQRAAEAGGGARLGEGHGGRAVKRLDRADGPA